jgi:hypothetical protein
MVGRETDVKSNHTAFPYVAQLLWCFEKCH